MEVQAQIGQAIHHLRKDNQMTLTQLGELAHLSPGHLSQIERGRAAPSLSALRAIADVFHVPLSNLLLEGNGSDLSQDDYVRRRSRRTKGQYPGTRVKFQLIEVPRNSLQLLWVTAPPGAVVEPHRRNSPGEECALVLSGKMRVSFNNSDTILEPGDAVFFQAHNDLHGWENIGDEELVALWVSNPRF